MFIHSIYISKYISNKKHFVIPVVLLCIKKTDTSESYSYSILNSHM